MNMRADVGFVADYARTLREWRRRFEATFEAEIVPALKEAYPELTTRKGIDVFRRKWICALSSVVSAFDGQARGGGIY